MLRPSPQLVFPLVVFASSLFPTEDLSAQVDSADPYFQPPLRSSMISTSPQGTPEWRSTYQFQVEPKRQQNGGLLELQMPGNLAAQAPGPTRVASNPRPPRARVPLSRLPGQTNFQESNPPTQHVRQLNNAFPQQGAAGSVNPRQPPTAFRQSTPNRTVSWSTTNLFQPAQILAQVGEETIFYGDISPQVEQAIHGYLKDLSEQERAKFTEDELNRQREMLIKQLLPNAVETKMLYVAFLNDAKRSAPADKLEEALSNVHDRAKESFDETELPQALERAKVTTSRELDTHLRQFGSSLGKQREMYAEQMLGRSIVGQNIDRDKEVTFDELLSYYHQNAEKYAIEPRARWEQLTVLQDRFESKAAAWQAIAFMGNEVLRGAPFGAVASRSSQASNADEGGLREATQGSLVSEQIDRAVFYLPEGQLSRIIEDSRGFHIVRVLERNRAGRVPFEEVQPEIKKDIQKVRMREQITTFLAKLREEIPISTIFEQTHHADESSRNDFSIPR